MRSRSSAVVGGEGGGGRLVGSWDLGISLDDNPLFRPAIRSLKPFLGFKDIKSSSSELLSILAIIDWGERATKALISSPSESGILTGSSRTSSSSSSQIDQFPTRGISARKQSLPLELLLSGENDGGAT